MKCYDPLTRVYYPHHDEYVGGRSDLAGRCVRCGEVTDPEAAAEGERQQAIQRRHDLAQQRWLDGVDTAEDRRILGRFEEDNPIFRTRKWRKR